MNDPLIAAARGGHLEIAKSLLADKADPAKTLDTGETAINIALEFQEYGYGRSGP